MRAAAMVDEASGIVVTSDTSRMPTAPELMPVMSAMLSALTPRKNPDTITPPDTSRNIAHALLRPIPGSSSASPAPAGRVL